MKKLSKETLCIHAGSYFDPVTQGVNSPVFTSTSFGYVTTDEIQYPRYFNTPNQKVVADKLCALENGEGCLIFSSGMAAITTVIFSMLQKGDHVIFQNEVYGGTHHFITSELDKFGIEYTLINDYSIENFADALNANTKIIYIESPSNPLLKIVDIKTVAELAISKGVLTVIDNTFASPINQNPLNMGIDVVIHSGTKYLGGHSDICFGAVVSSGEIIRKIHESAISFGGSLNASTCALIERSLKTLALRVNRQNENALSIAEFLQHHPEVEEIYYPGLDSHPGHDIANQQMTGYGGMLSFELTEHIDIQPFLDNLRLIKTAGSLGGVDTIICSPAQTSHEKLSPEDRSTAGIKDGLLRLSVGIEDVNDLIADFEHAFITVAKQEMPVVENE